MSNNHACHEQHNTIRPSSSSLIQAPSWSFGFGADVRDLDIPNGCCQDSVQDHCPQIASLSSSLPSTSNSSLMNHNCSHCRSHDDSEIHPRTKNTCPKIMIEIPTVYLHRKDSNSGSYHVYQLNIRTSANAHWSIFRRYSQFLTLHQKLKSKERAIGKFTFPPKRRLNSKASNIVQERRRRLEDYMEKLCDYIGQMAVNLAESNSYEMLHRLATNGPPRISSSSSSGADTLPEVSSLADSSRSGQADLDEDDSQQFSSAAPASESSPFGEQFVCQLSGDDMRDSTRGSGSERRLECGDMMQPVDSSVRSLFYHFICPNGAQDGQVELENLVT